MSEENLNTPANDLPDELKTIESALRQLQPADERIDRDRLMYLSGRASIAGPAASRSHAPRFGMRNGRFLWSLATAALVLLSLGMGGRLMYLEGRGDRIVYVQQPGQGPEAAFAAQSLPEPRPRFSEVSFKPVQRGGVSYLQLRDAVLAGGVGALPAVEKSTSSEQKPGPIDKHHERLRRDLLPIWPNVPRELLGG